MPDNLIIAPDGLVKVEPPRCVFCGRLAIWLPARRVACIAIGRTTGRSKGGTGTPRRKRAHGFDVDTDGASVIH